MINTEPIGISAPASNYKILDLVIIIKTNLFYCNFWNDLDHEMTINLTLLLVLHTSIVVTRVSPGNRKKETVRIQLEDQTDQIVI